MAVLFTKTIPFNHGNMSFKEALSGRLINFKTALATHMYSKNVQCYDVIPSWKQKEITGIKLRLMIKHKNLVWVFFTFTIINNKLHIVGRSAELKNPFVREWAKVTEQNKIMEKEINYYTK